MAPRSHLGYERDLKLAHVAELGELLKLPAHGRREVEALALQVLRERLRVGSALEGEDIRGGVRRGDLALEGVDALVGLADVEDEDVRAPHLLQLLPRLLALARHRLHRDVLVEHVLVAVVPVELLVRAVHVGDDRAAARGGRGDRADARAREGGGEVAGGER